MALVLSKGLVLTACGIAIGGIAAAWATRVLSRYLFGITPLDMATYVTVALLLVITSIAAVIIPLGGPLASIRSNASERSND